MAETGGKCFRARHGNCKAKIGAFKDALRRFLNGSAAQPENLAAICRKNAEQVRKILQALDGKDYRIRDEELIVFGETEGATWRNSP